jgi:hypothetical protein
MMKSVCKASEIISAVSFVVLAGFGNVADAEHIVMKNGDRITGSVKSLWDQKLVIEPGYADEMSVDVAEIAVIDAPRDFEIAFADGRKATAQFVGADENNERLVTFDGQRNVVLLSDISEIDEPEEYSEWDSRADVNTALSKGNTDSSNFRFGGSSTLKLGDHRHIADLSFAAEALESLTTKKQSLAKYAYNWLFKDALFFSANASYERDPIRLLDNRYIIGTGLGCDTWSDPWRTLSMQVGVGYQNEKIDNMRERNAIAYWELRFAHEFFDGDLDVFHNQRINKNIDGRPNTAYKTATGFRFEITDLLYANFEIDYDYETDPAFGASNEDLSVLVGLGLEY